MSGEELAQQIRDARSALGLTQEEMAARLGVTAVTVSRWERATEAPRDAAAILLAVAQLKVKARLVSLLGHAPEGYPAWAKEIPVGTPFWYFENEHGEPWVARRDGRTLRIAGGDLDWHEIVIEGSDGIRAEIARMTERPDTVNPFARALAGEWVLGNAEAAWVLSVLLACANPVRYAESRVGASASVSGAPGGRCSAQGRARRKGPDAPSSPDDPPSGGAVEGDVGGARARLIGGW